MHIHFLGIGGSGMSAVAQIAKAQGYEVTGCDLQTETPYLEKVHQAGIKIFSGHSPDHLKDVDLLAVTPAAFYQNDHHPEVELARQQGILVKWQDFLGNHLHQNHKVICVAGTHGKSTTTAWAGLLLEKANFDPTVEIGATATAWHNNVRLPAQAGLGQGKYFISEADEFHDNFKTFVPDIVILNNLEMDHPEYFQTYDNLLKTYAGLISRIKPNGFLIYNSHVTGTTDLLHSLAEDIKSQITLIPYNISAVSDVKNTTTSTSFTYKGQDYLISIPGRHNIENALGIIELAKILNISQSDLKTSLFSFTGIGRRLELIGIKNNIKVFDDYANHPTAFMASLQGIKQLTNNGPVWAIIEPHTFSRLRAVLHQLPQSLELADHVIITKIFPSREADPGDFSGADIAAATHHPNVHYIPEFPDVVKYLHSQLQAHNSQPQAILVMGSGLSYQLSRDIFRHLLNPESLPTSENGA